MGGKTSQSSSQVQIPPEVLARYNSVNATAQNVAQTPFKPYSSDPNAFVAPLTPTQNAGISNTNAAAGMAQPYFNSATGFALAGAGPVNPGALDTQKYMNPYLQTVLGSTEARVNQQNQQEMAGQTGNAINQGYFGGDRSGIASAVLQGQQELAGGQLYSGIASDAYQQALAAAAQQQGVQLGAGQANRQALQGAAGQLAELGTGAQGAALSGAQAQLGAGAMEQQTGQAGKTALYNQFLQQQSYPFQTAQFLANIAEGTGALSGSTTTTTQPGGLFMSDERLKEDMRPIGKGFDGANIYRFRYKDDPENVTRLGFSAQEMARHHPEAVHSVGGFGAVDQTAATDESARRGGFAMAANDNGGDDREAPRMARQGGGLSEWGMYPQGANPMVIAQMLQAQEQMYGPYAQGGLYGGSPSGAPHGGATGYVPAANMPVGQLQTARPPDQSQRSDPLHTVAQLGDDARAVKGDVSDAKNWLSDQSWSPTFDASKGLSQADLDSLLGAKNGGFIRAHRDMGGGFGPGNGGDPSDPHNDDPYKTPGPGLAIPTAETQHPQLAVAKPPGSGGSNTLDQLGSTAGDIASIAKLAMMFARGGRAGFATGGGPLDNLRGDLEGGDDDPLEHTLLKQMLARPDAESEAGPAPAPAPAGPALAAPGFAGAKPPDAPAAAAEPGFAGAKPDSSLGHIYGLEGTGPNPHSSAVGVGQLLDGTYMGLLREAHPDIAAQVGNDRAAIKAFRRTAEGLALSHELAPMNQNKNRAIMEHSGIPVTPTNEHVMWILGAGDGPKVLHADPSTPLKGLISDAAIAANPSIMAGKTAGQFKTWARVGMAGGGRAGFAGAGVVNDDVTNTSGSDAYVADDGSVHTPLPRTIAPPPDDTPAPTPTPAAADGVGLPGEALHDQGFLPADQTGGAGAPSAHGVDLDAAARRNELGQVNLARTVQEQRGPQGGGFLGMLGRNWIPLLQGAAAWSGAPTQHPLVALMQGAGAFAGAEQQQRQYQLGQAKTLAELAQTGEHADTGASQGQTARINAISPFLAAALDPGGTIDRWFPPAHQVKNGETQYFDMRPGHHEGDTIGQSQVNQIRQQVALAGAAAIQRGDVSGVLNSTYNVMGNTPGGVAPPSGAPNAPPPVPPAGPSATVGNSGPGGGGGNTPDGRVPGGTPQPGGGPPAVGGAPPGHILPRSADAPPGTGTAPAPPGTAPATVPAPAPARVAGQPPPGGWGDTIEDRRKSGYYGQQPFNAPLPDESKLAPTSSPTWLRNQAAQLRLHGDPDAAAADEETAGKIETGDKNTPVMDAAGNQIPNPFIGYNQARNKQEELSAANTKQHAAYIAGAEAFRTSGPNLQTLLDMQARTSQGSNMNTLTPELEKGVGMLRSIPGFDAIVPDAVKVWQSNAGEAEKVQAARQMLAAGMEHLQHAPGQAMHVAGSAIPGPDAPPGARYANDLVTQATLLRDQQWYDDVANGGDTITRWDRFSHDWQAANPMTKYLKQAVDRIGGYYKGMAPQEIWRYPRHPQTLQERQALPSGTPIMWPPGPGGREQWIGGPPGTQ